MEQRREIRVTRLHFPGVRQGTVPFPREKSVPLKKNWPNLATKIGGYLEMSVPIVECPLAFLPTSTASSLLPAFPSFVRDDVQRE